MRPQRGRRAALAIGLAAAIASGGVPARAAAGQTASLDRAAALLEQGRAIEAERSLRDVLAEAPSGQASYLLGFALISQYRYEEAEAELRRAVASEPRQAGWLHALAKAELEQGKNLAAIGTLDRALEVDPRPDLHFARAMCRLNVGEQEAAAADLRAVLALEPRHAEARFKLGRILFDRAEFAASHEQLTLSLEANPRHLEARYLLGLVAHKLGDLEAAKVALEAVIDRVPGHVGALLNLGRVQIASGHPAEGQATLDRFRTLSEVQDQVEYLSRANKKNPRNADGRLALADRLLALGRAEEALDQALAARALVPRQVRVYRLLATIFERLGRPSDAARATAFARQLESGS